MIHECFDMLAVAEKHESRIASYSKVAAQIAVIVTVYLKISISIKKTH
jgi:hypothetical protein